MRKRAKSNTFPPFYEVLSKDELRPPLMHAISFNGYLWGTNGHIMARMRLDKWGDKQGHGNNKVYSKEMLQEMHKSKQDEFIFTPEGIIIKGQLRHYDGLYDPETRQSTYRGFDDDYNVVYKDFIRFPDYENVMPREDAGSVASAACVGINATHLMTLAKAIGADYTELRFHPKKAESSAIRVHFWGNSFNNRAEKIDYADGVIMPFCLATN